MKGKLFMIAVTGILALNQGCSQKKEESQESKKPLSLIVVEPGHFHAALVQKSMYADVDSVVHVYASEGPDVKAYLDKIDKYNTRAEEPTSWKEEVYTGADFLDKMLSEKKGNVVVLAGNNQKKTDFIKKSVDAGLNVLADKPMAIDAAGFDKLQEAFTSAEKNKVLLYDIMTERYEITNTLQRELAALPDIFGELQKGTPTDPSVVKESVHHFFKYISGEALVRPSWFFDVNQQGEGMVDVTTHLVDLVQWSCFPNVILDYKNDINLLSTKRTATKITPSQFKLVTKSDTYPDFLKKDVTDSTLNVYSNGELNYTLKGVHAKVSVIWNFQAPEGTGDTHYSIMKGSKANLIVRQGKDQKYKPVLYIETKEKGKVYEDAVAASFKSVQDKFPGIELKKNKAGWEISIPAKYDNGHEAHFAQVANKYMEYLKAGKLPEWEVPNMIAKYYTTTQALKQAKEKK
ncbi:putative oxidoreductase C-terminal domain-containing protein [Dyadobacter sp. CY312]|uniref:putative oxidoreductase C-terminal domain-containing protein n=1 Tax=Dyadobacter sp. CY312 TaxID=2907303 RepID=UPI001F2880B8|nr:putative oxidoreductase C-terminal domain-containing protein [Dyadobacter sp. CY312]MCE7041857.1 Gfo/Idh/MocA family oxidoreductase [Dyadobacter sp. CY312]